MQYQAPRLIQLLLKGQWNPDEDGVFLNDLLDDFQHGYPIHELLQLFRNEDTGIVRAASWIASELGTKACVIFDDIESFVNSFDPKVRFNLIDCILVCGNNGKSIVKIFFLLEDKVSFVRWRAIDSLCKLSHRQIALALETASLQDNTKLYISGLNLLQRNLADRDLISQLENIFAGQDPLMKKFAIAAAIRNKLERKKIQELAKISDDEDIINFCMD